MPERLQRVAKGSLSINLSPDAASKQPALAAVVARIISLGSHADYVLGRTLIDMLGPKAAPAFAMYEALNFGYAKTAALEAAAGMTLDDEDLLLFTALLRLYGQDQKQRNKFAHWLWLYSEGASEYLVLQSPLDALRWRARLAHIPPGATGAAKVKKLSDTDPFNGCECYSAKELEAIAARFAVTLSLIESFRHLVSPIHADEPKDPIRTHLRTQPRLVGELRRLKKQIETRPSTLPEQP